MATQKLDSHNTKFFLHKVQIIVAKLFIMFGCKITINKMTDE